jgi:predicted nuclease with RNAse H fold
MQKLTLRGMKISQFLKDSGYKVIESYPGAAQDILHFPRKKVSLEELKKELIAMGIDVYTNRTLITHDEIDALTSALVGFFYMADMYEAIGNEQEGLLIIPDLQNWEK